MKPARSATHGGSASISVHGRPATCASATGSLFSLTLFRIVHAWLVSGDAHTRPVQSVSCHATRTDTCDKGNLIAPSESECMAAPPFRRQPNPLYGVVLRLPTSTGPDPSPHDFASIRDADAL